MIQRRKRVEIHRKHSPKPNRFIDPKARCFWLTKKKNAEFRFFSTDWKLNPTSISSSFTGKSTLLDIIADRKSSGRTTGKITLNAETRSARHKGFISYIPQQETLTPKQTVREVIRYYADLQLDPKEWKSQQKDVLVNQIIDLMGLTERANTYVGGVMPGGLQNSLKKQIFCSRFRTIFSTFAILKKYDRIESYGYIWRSKEESCGTFFLFSIGSLN